MAEEPHVTAKRESSERTSVLANERTYAAWVRTGLSAMATGLGAAAFLGGVISDRLIHSLSCILLLLSATCFFLAAWRYRHVGVRMVSTHVAGAPVTLMCMISAFLIAAAVIALVGIWM